MSWKDVNYVKKTFQERNELRLSDKFLVSMPNQEYKIVYLNRDINMNSLVKYLIWWFYKLMPTFKIWWVFIMLNERSFFQKELIHRKKGIQRYYMKIIDRYEISILQMTMDIFRLSWIQIRSYSGCDQHRMWLYMHRLWLLSNTTGATSGAGVANPSGAPELTLVFVGFVLLQL